MLLGFAFASATSACTDAIFLSGATTSTSGTLPSGVMAEKSFTGSYGTFVWIAGTVTTAFECTSMV
jgi:hypothetical protein